MTTAPARVPWYEQPPPRVARPTPRARRSVNRCLCGELLAVHTRVVMRCAARLVVRGRPPQASTTGCTRCSCSMFEPDDGTASSLGSIPTGCENNYSGGYGDAVNGGER